MRPGEKIHEEMISVNDSENTLDAGKYYIIINNNTFSKYKKLGFKKVKESFSYNSGTNNKFLNVIELRKLIKNLNLN